MWAPVEEIGLFVRNLVLGLAALLTSEAVRGSFTRFDSSCLPSRSSALSQLL